MERRDNAQERLTAELVRKVHEMEGGHTEFKLQAQEDRRVLQTITTTLATLTERIDQGFKYLGNEMRDLRGQK